MKIQLLTLLACAVIFASSCKKDDPIPGEATLKYDNPNATGPLLEAGFHELAVYFPSNMMGQYRDWSLTEVTWYMGGFPDSCVVKIYEEGSGDTPGALLYENDVTGTTVVNQWQEHLLPTPLTVSGDGIWISIALRHDTEKQSIGCDSGPNQTNGDWLYKESDQQWLTYVQRTSESVNWNIRAIVEE